MQTCARSRLLTSAQKIIMTCNIMTLSMRRAQPGDLVLSVKELTFSYPGKALLTEPSSFELSAGDSAALTGKNGSGKTTTLSLILGKLSPLSGTVDVLGASVKPVRVAYLPQRVSFPRPDMISLASLFASAWPRAVFLSQSQKDEVQAIRKTANLDHYPLKTPLSELSGGELQRALIARLLLTSSDLMLLDEPFNNLDEDAQHLTCSVIRQAAKTKALITVTHQKELTPLFASCKLSIEKGKIQKKASIE